MPHVEYCRDELLPVLRNIKEKIHQPEFKQVLSAPSLFQKVRSEVEDLIDNVEEGSAWADYLRSLHAYLDKLKLTKLEGVDFRTGGRVPSFAEFSDLVDQAIGYCEEVISGRIAYSWNVLVNNLCDPINRVYNQCKEHKKNLLELYSDLISVKEKLPEFKRKAKTLSVSEDELEGLKALAQIRQPLREMQNSSADILSRDHNIQYRALTTARIANGHKNGLLHVAHMRLGADGFRKFFPNVPNIEADLQAVDDFLQNPVGARADFLTSLGTIVPVLTDMANRADRIVRSARQ